MGILTVGRRILLIVCVLLGGAMQGMAWASAKNDTLSIEEQQQFLYYFYEAERLIQTEQIEQAKPVVEFCYAINPNDATINNYMGLYAKAEGDSCTTAAYFRRAYELAPETYWYNYHVLLLQSNNKKQQQQAIKQMETLAKTDTKNSELHEVLQKAYILHEQFDKALAIQDLLDSINGYDAMSAMMRYRLNATLRKNKQAIYEIERYLEIEPDNYQFQLFRMQLYEQTQQPPTKLITAYEAVLRLDPRNLMVMNNLAWIICTSGGNMLRAEELSRITIMREPSNPIYLDTYGWIMHLLGDCESAKFYLQRAIEYSGNEVDKEVIMHYKETEKKCK